MTDALACYACGETYERGERTRCACGEPLWIETDSSGFDWGSLPDEPGMWRYGQLLPVDPPTEPDGGADAAVTGLGAGAGGTPLVRTPRIDDVAGCRTYLKDEGQNPTGSFKDRGSAVGVAAAASRNRAIGTVSHGNMAMSVAAHAASADVPCAVLVPADISEARLRLIGQYDPTVIRVDGDYGRLYERSLELGPDFGISFVNSDSPLRVAGQATTVLEIVERFAPDVPDAIVLPVSSGGHASAAWKALRDLDEADALPSTPALHFVQAAPSAPIADAFVAGAETVSPTDGGGTIAYSIGNGDPPSGNRALAAARATGGSVTAVTDDEIRTATARFARRTGACVEPASATTLAGARTLADEGLVDGDDEVVLVATGTGFKEPAGTPAPPDSPPVQIDDLETALADRLA